MHSMLTAETRCITGRRRPILHPTQSVNAQAVGLGRPVDADDPPTNGSNGGANGLFYHRLEPRRVSLRGDEIAAEHHEQVRIVVGDQVIDEAGVMSAAPSHHDIRGWITKPLETGVVAAHDPSRRSQP